MVAHDRYVCGRRGAPLLLVHTGSGTAVVTWQVAGF